MSVFYEALTCTRFQSSTLHELMDINNWPTDVWYPSSILAIGNKWDLGASTRDVRGCANKT